MIWLSANVREHLSCFRKGLCAARWVEDSKISHNGEQANKKPMSNGKRVQKSKRLNFWYLNWKNKILRPIEHISSCKLYLVFIICLESVDKRNIISSPFIRAKLKQIYSNRRERIHQSLQFTTNITKFYSYSVLIIDWIYIFIWMVFFASQLSFLTKIVTRNLPIPLNTVASNGFEVDVFNFMSATPHTPSTKRNGFHSRTKI